MCWMVNRVLFGIKELLQFGFFNITRYSDIGNHSTSLSAIAKIKANQHLSLFHFRVCDNTFVFMRIWSYLFNCTYK